MSSETSGIEAAIADLRRRRAAIEPGVRLIVRKSSAGMEADSKQLAAVDTGNMRSAINTRIHSDQHGADVRSPAPYSGFVENGTSRQAPQPFMYPSLLRAAPGFIKSLGQLVNGKGPR